LRLFAGNYHLLLGSGVPPESARRSLRAIR